MAQQEWTDYYAVLELYDPVSRTGSGPDSSPQEIKEAWRFQLQAWHPDKFPAGTKPRERAEARSKVINAAYDVLKNTQTKEAFDREWLRRNAWFRDGQGAKEETTSTLPPEITVRWDPPNVQGTVFYNIPKGEKRQATLSVEPRVGKGFAVEILEPESDWLRVLSPSNRRANPPFTATIGVDTSALLTGEEYKDRLIFVLGSSKGSQIILHGEPVRLRVQPTSVPSSPGYKGYASPDRKGYYRGPGALIAALVIMSAVFLLRDWIWQFAGFGYPGVFVVGLWANATILIPAPNFAFATVFARNGALNPILLGIVAGLGAAIGELTGYLAGISGRGMVSHLEAYQRFEQLVRRYGVFAIALLATIPNPFFDVVGILSGVLRIPAWQFVLATWVGKSLRFTLVATSVLLPLIR